jgi:hemoglobin
VAYDLFIVNMPEVTSDARRPSQPDWSYEADSRATSSADQNSLYERLGARPGIYNLMSASIDSLHNNEQLNRQNPTLGSLRGKTNAADLKEKVTDYICKMTGGPCTYKGRTLRASHAPLNITESDWRVFVDDFERVMTDYGVRSREQQELLVLMSGTKADILNSQASRFTM